MDIHSFAEEIFNECPCRFNKKEKKAMLQKARQAMLEAGWSEDEVRVQEHKGLISSQNLIIGNPAEAGNYITAHYDTPGRSGWMLTSSKLVGMTGANIVFIVAVMVVAFAMSFGVEVLTGFLAERLPDTLSDAWADVIFFGISMLPALLYFVFMAAIIAIKNPNNRNDNTSGTLATLKCAALAAANPEMRKSCCFVLFDNEELGLVGSAQFAKWCKGNGVKLEDKKVYNLDCVGAGEQLYAARTGKRTAAQQEMLDRLKGAGLELEEKRSALIFMSDHASFPNGYMLSYMRKSKIGAPYIPNLHTPKDVECDVDMIDDLAERLAKAVCSGNC